MQEVSRLVGSFSGTHKTNYIADLILAATFYLGGKYYQPIPASVRTAALSLSLVFIIGCFAYAEWQCRYGRRP